METATDTSDSGLASTCPPSPWVSVTAGRWMSCGIHADGCAECWRTVLPDGWMDCGETDPPDESFASIDLAADVADSDHEECAYGCGVLRTGEISCWGGIRGGGPEGQDYVKVSSGRLVACGLTASGDVRCFGNYDLVVDDERLVDVAVADGNPVCVLRVDGSVTCWRSPLQGEKPSYERAGPYTALDGGDNRICGILADGSLDCWWADDGDPAYGWPTGFDYRAVSVGSLACTLTDGDVARCWVYEEHGVPNVGFAQISAGFDHACGLTLEGTIECWGDCDYGECDPPQ